MIDGIAFLRILFRLQNRELTASAVRGQVNDLVRLALGDHLRHAQRIACINPAGLGSEMIHPSSLQLFDQLLSDRTSCTKN